MDVLDLAAKIVGCYEYEGQEKSIPELAEKLGVSQDDVNLAIDWLVNTGYGRDRIVPDELVDQEPETEFDREHLETCLNAGSLPPGEEITVDAEWLQSVWNMAQDLMGEG